MPQYYEPSPELLTILGRNGRVIPVATKRLTRPANKKRRHVDPTTTECQYNAEQMAFMQAIEDYKKQYRRPFPTWSEVLEIVHALGYRKVAPPEPLPQRPRPDQGKGGLA